MATSAVQQAINEQSTEALMVPDLDDLSYILYTSGELLCGIGVWNLSSV